jgi:hypothetical protein
MHGGPRDVKMEGVSEGGVKYRVHTKLYHKY